MYLFASIGTVSGTIVGFNATKYSATISEDTPVQAPVLSVGLTMDDGTETYSLSTRVSLPAVSPFQMRFSGERRGEIYVIRKINIQQDITFRFTVRTTLSSNADITADVDITVVSEPLSE